VKILTYTPCTASVKAADIGNLRVYPQPARDDLQIQLSGRCDVYNIFVTDILGKNIKVPFEVSDESNVSINISALPKGIYLLNANLGSMVYSAKFLKD
jgi:hypothetical protein